MAASIINNMKTCLFICISMILLSACNDTKQKNADTKEAATQTAAKASETTSVANALDIKIPESTDPELNDFFKSYTAHLNEYVQAVRENNKTKIETSYQKEKKFRIQLLSMPARLDKTAPAEWEKYQNYRQKTMNYWNEIEKSDYVKQLHDEAIKRM